MASNIRIDGPRLVSTLMDLATIGATPEGGCRRMALSEEDRLGRNWLAARMRGLGLDVRVDMVGNIVGILKGQEDGPAVIMGSHIDTVGTGGRYDGALGVVAGLELMATLRDLGLRPKRDLALIAFTNEEGARFHPDMLGSVVWAGAMTPEEVYAERDAGGFVLGEELEKIGYKGTEKPGFLKARAYFELHIEQGPVLEQEGFRIGAVTGVQAITWLEITFTGQPNHGGTTPMKYRRDAGLAAARVNLLAHAVTRRITGQLANMGVIRVEPGNVNVVPEKVICTLDLRNPDDALLAKAEAEIRAFAAYAAAKAEAGVAIRDLARFPSQPFDERLIARVESAAKAHGHSVRRIVSGAGHDAQMMATLCPTAMIFVPSTGGLSHNPKEFSTEADIIAGANVLAEIAWEEANA
ncbi:MAG: Zn-dependent hydrolase [Methylobacterium sp.]|nr:Zn-dependent hydrolase [Methylobacterium sp.]MCA3639907.1 Zn-dependent hydrolase [Methylobacterium sp.]